MTPSSTVHGGQYHIQKGKFRVAIACGIRGEQKLGDKIEPARTTDLVIASSSTPWSFVLVYSLRGRFVLFTNVSVSSALS